MFITFEGIDCSGKSTQAKLLVDCLAQTGKEVLFLREPGGTAVSETIRDLLLDLEHAELSDTAELMLFSAARAQLVREVIRPALAKGSIVISDRFYDSTTAYQGYGRSLNIEDVHTINRIAVGGTTPDITVLVDVGVDEVLRRQQAAGKTVDRMEAGGKSFFERVRNGYLQIAAEEPFRFFVVDGTRPIDVIHQEIWQFIRPRII